LRIPPNSIPCHLINIFGPKTRSQSRRRTGLSYPVPANWVAKWGSKGIFPKRASGLLKGYERRPSTGRA